MQVQTLPRRPRGRPSKSGSDYADTRALLVRTGVEVLTEQGMGASTLDQVLTRSGVPKGSFYHYFENKNAFVAAALDSYAGYFAAKLDRHLGNPALSPLSRLQAFVADACDGMARYQFQRGCLVGNLGQEVTCLEEPLRLRLEEIFRDWESRLSLCLAAAIEAGELRPGSDCAALAHAFWIGWEGAILRARLIRSSAPMTAFASLFSAALSR